MPRAKSPKILEPRSTADASAPRTQRTTGGAQAHTPRYQLFTDGACLGNPGPGGWAFILRHPAATVDAPSSGAARDQESSGGERATTNNRMELMAVIQGLQAVPQADAAGTRASVDLVGDSEYVLKGIAEWLPGWKAKGWRLAKGGAVKNADLWRAIDDLLSVVDVRSVWVKGHAGHDENERCDQLASAQAARWATGEGLPTPPIAGSSTASGLFGGA